MNIPEHLVPKKERHSIDDYGIPGLKRAGWFSALADAFTPPEARRPIRLDHASGYEARARDLQRIGDDMRKAMRELGLEGEEADS